MLCPILLIDGFNPLISWFLKATQNCRLSTSLNQQTPESSLQAKCRLSASLESTTPLNQGRLSASLGSTTPLNQSRLSASLESPPPYSKPPSYIDWVPPLNQGRVHWSDIERGEATIPPGLVGSSSKMAIDESLEIFLWMRVVSDRLNCHCQDEVYSTCCS